MKEGRLKTTLEFVTVGVVLCTLVANVWLAMLQSKANALNARAVLESQSPWLGVQRGQISLDGNRLVFVVTIANCSTSPAMGMSGSLELIGNNHGVDEAISKPRKNEVANTGNSILLGNHDTVFTLVVDNLNAEDAETTLKSIFAGHTAIRTTISYTDVAKRPFKLITTGVYDATTNIFGTLSAEIIPPPDF